MHKLYKIRTLLDLKGVKPKYNYVHIDEFFMAIFFCPCAQLELVCIEKKTLRKLQ